MVNVPREETSRSKGEGGRAGRVGVMVTGVSAALWLLNSQAIVNAAKTVWRLAGKWLEG